MNSEFFDDLRARGLVHASSEGVAKALAAGPVTAYIGFDPTADSMHVGHLVQALGLARLQRAGHRPIALVGGGTGMIGDPSGKSVERPLLTRDQVHANVDGLRAQLERFLDFTGPRAARMVDNHEWLGGLGVIHFLRDVGKHFTVNYMLAKDSVARRLDSEAGLSVTEFAYSLLQAYDFAELHDRFGCTLQMGGSDQWGNITSGMELVRRTRGRSVHGIVQPLLTNANGTKFGKTESGAVWLDPRRTSPFRFFQFWLNADDRDVRRYLNTFTFLLPDAIGDVLAAHEANPAARAAQRRPAAEVTRMVHGDDGLARAEQATGVLFGSVPAQELPADELLDVFADVPSTEVARSRLEGEGMGVAEILADAGVAASKSEARRLIAGGGVSLNGARITSPDQRVRAEDAIGGRVLLLRKGKRENRVVRLVG